MVIVSRPTGELLAIWQPALRSRLRVSYFTTIALSRNNRRYKFLNKRYSKLPSLGAMAFTEKLPCHIGSKLLSFHSILKGYISI